MFHGKNIKTTIKSCETLREALLEMISPLNKENLFVVSLAPYREGLTRQIFDKQLQEVKKRFERKFHLQSVWYCFFEVKKECIHCHIIIDLKTITNGIIKKNIQKHIDNVFNISRTDKKSLLIQQVDKRFYEHPTIETLINYNLKDMDKDFTNLLII